MAARVRLAGWRVAVGGLARWAILGRLAWELVRVGALVVADERSRAPLEAALWLRAAELAVGVALLGWSARAPARGDAAPDRVDRSDARRGVVVVPVDARAGPRGASRSPLWGAQRHASRAAARP